MYFYFLQADTVKSHVKVLGLYNFTRGFGWAYKWWAYIWGRLISGINIRGRLIIIVDFNMGYYSTCCLI